MLFVEPCRRGGVSTLVSALPFSCAERSCVYERGSAIGGLLGRDARWLIEFVAERRAGDGRRGA